MTIARPRAAACAAAVALLASATPAAQATVVVAKGFAALCAEADLIFVGTVQAVASRWGDPTRQAIETAVTFAGVTWLRGGPGAAVTLTFAGGEVDGLREEIAGVPRFRVGDRGVLFARQGRFVSPLVGFSQGAFRVADGAAGPVVLTAEGHPVVAVDGAALRLGAPTRASAAAAEAVSLDDFLDRVRRELAAQSGGR